MDIFGHSEFLPALVRQRVATSYDRPS